MTHRRSCQLSSSRTVCLLLTTPGVLRAALSSLPTHWDSTSRSSHYDFFLQRNWGVVESFWRHTVASGSLPPELNINLNYARTDCGLQQIQEIGMLGEFKSRDSRYQSRRTYALRIGYLGTAFQVLLPSSHARNRSKQVLLQGYQRQRGQDGSSLRTVEGEVRLQLGRVCVCAGRTDGNVSALSQVRSLSHISSITAIYQVLSFISSKDLDMEQIIREVNASESAREGHLAAYECVRVPRKFNARSQATWRRYIYLFPLQRAESGEFDVDVHFVSAALQR